MPKRQRTDTAMRGRVPQTLASRSRPAPISSSQAPVPEISGPSRQHETSLAIIPSADRPTTSNVVRVRVRPSSQIVSTHTPICAVRLSHLFERRKANQPAVLLKLSASGAGLLEILKERTELHIAELRVVWRFMQEASHSIPYADRDGVHKELGTLLGYRLQDNIIDVLSQGADINLEESDPRVQDVCERLDEESGQYRRIVCANWTVLDNNRDKTSSVSTRFYRDLGCLLRLGVCEAVDVLRRLKALGKEGKLAKPDPASDWYFDNSIPRPESDKVDPATSLSIKRPRTKASPTKASPAKASSIKASFNQASFNQALLNKTTPTGPSALKKIKFSGAQLREMKAAEEWEAIVPRDRLSAPFYEQIRYVSDSSSSSSEDDEYSHEADFILEETPKLKKRKLVQTNN